jgi:hypothetical protein
LRLTWPDRRPVGAVFLAKAELEAARNPRGWLGDKQWDAVSKSGQQVFRERMLAFARQRAEECVACGAQGVVVWDVEGQEHDHPVSFLGDPTQLKKLAPEMDRIADELMAEFSQRGLRTGLCIRPQEFESGWLGGEQCESKDPGAVLDRKVTYAKRRWGCTLFYVDSNHAGGKLLPLEVMTELARRHPDCLFIPQVAGPGYHTVSAPFGDSRGGRLGSTRDTVRQAVPGAFSVVRLWGFDAVTRRAELEAAARSGDVFFVEGGNAPNDAVVAEVSKAGRGK